MKYALGLVEIPNFLEYFSIIILSGWQSKLDPTNMALKPFANRKLELSTVDGVILWGNGVVVPYPGQTLLLWELHACHPGITRMKSLAHMSV